MHPGDDDQPRWPEGTPVRPDGHGPGGGRFRGTGDIGGVNVDDLVGGLQGASSRPWYETAAGQIAQRQAGGHPRVAYNLAVINAAQVQNRENRGDGYHDEQLPQLIAQHNAAEIQGNPAGQDVAVDQLREWIDSHYPEQWAGALPARVEAREAPRAADQDQRNSAALDLARTAQANIEANTGDPDDALAIRIEALERHIGRTGHRVEADREAAALRRYMDHEMNQEAASPPGTAVMQARLEASRPDDLADQERPASQALRLFNSRRPLEMLGRRGWARVENIDVTPEGDHLFYLEGDDEPISMGPDDRVAIRLAIGDTRRGSAEAVGRMIGLAPPGMYEIRDSDGEWHRVTGTRQGLNTWFIESVTGTEIGWGREDQVEWRLHPGGPFGGQQAEPVLDLGGQPATDRDAWNRLVVYTARLANYRRQRLGQDRDEIMDQMVADIEHPDVTDVQGVADSNSEVLRQRLERIYGASIIDPPSRGVTAFDRQHQAHIDRLMGGGSSDGLEALDDRDLRDLAIEYGMGTPPTSLTAENRATMIEHIRRQRQAEAAQRVARGVVHHHNANWSDTHISHQRPGFYRQAVDVYQMPLQVRDAEGVWRNVISIGYPTDGLYEITTDGPTGRMFVPENHTITARIGSNRSGTRNENRRLFNQHVAVIADTMLEQVDPEDRADDEGYARLRAKLDIYDDATANQSDQESIDSAVDDLVNELADWDIYFDVPPHQDYDDGGSAYSSRFMNGYDDSDDEDFDALDQEDIPELYGSTELRSAISHWPDLDYHIPDLPDSYRDRAVQIWDYTDPVTGYRSEVESVQIDNSELEIKGTIYGPDGSSRGIFTRTISPSKPHEVHHAYFKLFGDSQGGGFSTRWLEHVKTEYRKNGFTQISVDADIDVGGYAWAKAGFDFAERYDMNAMLTHLDGVASNAGPLSGSVTDLVKQQIAQLRARAARGEHITPLEISMIGWDERIGYNPVSAPPVTPSGDTIDMWFGKEFLLRYGNSNKTLYNHPAGHPVVGQGWRGIIQL